MNSIYALRCHIVHPPPSLKERGEVNFDYLPRRGEYEKLKYRAGAGLLKKGRGVPDTFPN